MPDKVSEGSQDCDSVHTWVVVQEVRGQRTELLTVKQTFYHFLLKLAWPEIKAKPTHVNLKFYCLNVKVLDANGLLKSLLPTIKTLNH